MRFTTFIGVDLGGGKGKNTAVAYLEANPDGGVRVVDYGTGKGGPWYDDALVAYLQSLPHALVAIDAPLTLPSCVRCTLDACPGAAACDVPIMAWFRAREAAHPSPTARKPRYTAYTQRATEVLLAEEQGIVPREALGQGMGPLAARGVYLRRALAGTFRLNDNLIEVYPKATLTRLVGARLAGRTKRSAASPAARLAIFNGLPELRFAPGVWREDGLANDHKFDAVISAYTAWLWSRGLCAPPPDPQILDDGWIWAPLSGAERLTPPAS